MGAIKQKRSASLSNRRQLNTNSYGKSAAVVVPTVHSQSIPLNQRAVVGRSSADPCRPPQCEWNSSGKTPPPFDPIPIPIKEHASLLYPPILGGSHYTLNTNLITNIQSKLSRNKASPIPTSFHKQGKSTKQPTNIQEHLLASSLHPPSPSKIPSSSQFFP